MGDKNTLWKHPLQQFDGKLHVAWVANVKGHNQLPQVMGQRRATHALAKHGYEDVVMQIENAGQGQDHVSARVPRCCGRCHCGQPRIHEIIKGRRSATYVNILAGRGRVRNVRPVRPSPANGNRSSPASRGGGGTDALPSTDLPILRGRGGGANWAEQAEGGVCKVPL